eukprot:CAMPEP_0197533826 /NCGR_PEP_ID=MMETSP1318-20131121/44822_1 /TAXON_ID=552666 /ORGANISM="Partenskyella glossopodia, Strain RCC365" /LENGTH=505 /DNA_ID=CAMNT_0043090855 /DNA_START=129 /DNA_END=1646 /DNA_ORIENTATION=-
MGVVSVLPVQGRNFKGGSASTKSGSLRSKSRMGKDGLEDSKESLAAQIEKLKVETQQMHNEQKIIHQQMAMSSRTAPPPQNNGFGGGQNNASPTWATAFFGNGGMNGQQDPDTILRAFSRKFREKEDKYKQVIEKLSRINQDLSLAKSKQALELKTLQNELHTMRGTLEKQSKDLEAAQIIAEEHKAKQAQLKRRHADHLKLRERQAAAMAARLEKERANRRAQIVKLTEDVNIKTTKITSLEDKLDAVSASERKAVEEREEIQKEFGAPDVRTLQKRSRELEDELMKTRVHLEKLKSLNESFSHSLDRAAKEKVELVEELRKLQIETNQSTLSAKESKASLDQMALMHKLNDEKLAHELHEKSKMLEIMRGLREKLMTSEEDLLDVKAEIEQHQITAEDYKERYNLLQEATVKEHGEFSYLRQGLESAKKEKEELEKKLVKAKLEIDRLVATNRQLLQKLALAADLDALDLDKLNDIMSSSRKMAGALEVIKKHVERTGREIKQ